MKRARTIFIIATSAFLAFGASIPARAGDWADYSSFISEIDGSMEVHLKDVAALGESLGRTPGRMGQIGDSITESSAFFRNAVLNGPSSNQTGHDYAPIRSWLAYNNAMPADANSFYRDHGKGNEYGCQSQWKLSSAVASGHPAQGVNEGNGSTPGDYSWVLVMFGTNDIDSGSWNAQTWKSDYRQFAQGYLDLGVIPVLSTIPPEQAHVGDGKVQAANAVILEICAELNIPYVDFYGLVLFYQPTSWNGTLISSDGTHPSAGGGGVDFSQSGLTTTDGYAARTKLAFDVAEVLRDRVFTVKSSIAPESWGMIKSHWR